jgi:saccharopine dehydrogenase-like NADP-dependent oxidoreductase
MATVDKLKRAQASGQVGGETLRSVLEHGAINVTAISREQSTSIFSPGVIVKKGDYTSSFLEAALQGQDVVIIALSTMVPPDIQINIIRAAIKVGVPWIVPNEYGSDGENEELSSAIPFLGSKKKYRDMIEESGSSSWIGIACNPWFDFV